MITNYRRDIDGLRAVAVLAVLFYHLDFSYFPGGFVGVDVFFVISGYLITGIIAKGVGRGDFSFLNFYARRIKRIFPALFVMLLLCSAGAFLFLGDAEYKDYFRAQRYGIFQASNFYFAKKVDYFALDQSPSALLHTWSLGVEEQFYLFWPVFILLIHKLWGVRRCLAAFGVVFAASLFMSEYLLRQDATAAFYLLHARAWELALGGITALGAVRPVTDKRLIDVISLASLAVLAYTVATYSEQNFPGLKAVLPCVATAALIYSAREKQGVGHRFLSLAPMVGIGLISYSLYLWHWPVVAFYKSFMGDALSTDVKWMMAAAAVLLGYLSYRYVERPTRHLDWPDARVLKVALLVVAAFLMMNECMKSLSASDLRVTRSFERMHEYSPMVRKCYMRKNFDSRDMCLIGDRAGAKKALLIGSSHAGHFTDMLNAWAKAHHVQLDLLITDSCTPWTLAAEGTGNARTKCASFKKDAYAYLQALKDKNVVYDYVLLGAKYDTLLKDHNDNAGALAADMQDSFDFMRPLGRHMVVLGQVPLFRENPLNCYYKNALLLAESLGKPAPEACLVMDKDYSEKRLAPSTSVMIDQARKNGFLYFDPTLHITSGFSSGDDPLFLYHDDDHLNLDGSLYLTPAMTDFLNGI